ncbi:ABC transporter substrate-binding protein [Enterovirga rhinocerotis]|uniref:Amino acid/amide ABC transporter substrate-binding protein (HAAT family) n=1 Tax=Enterovirga rhinocerotis TaxID=1339210 RepID=A0A4V3DZ97_9HYPH|nr:ABC transporter substrate-binding protein [Enterovirga rhinocerotis]TDR95665.1 amino acid/amide ABC transporter substrate-binding protein (HAAT family) [Enterovirga rhinocerotis]
MRSMISATITWLLVAVWLVAGTAAPSAQAPGGVLKIGVLTDSSSGYADFGGQGSIEAARMAIEDFGGSVAGMTIELVSADHQNKADIGAGIARRWFDQEGVDVIVDLPNSAVALAVQSLARERQKVLLVTSALSSDITGKACSPTTAHWTYDTYSQATVTGRALAAEGRSWFFLAADYAFGHSLARDLGDIVGSTGGKVLGTARHPLNTADFSSFLLTAQSSGAGIIALANGGADTINSIKQAGEFGIGRGDQKLAALVIYITDVHSLGLAAAQGLLLTSPFYWDQSDATRAFSRRFLERRGMVPTMVQASAYGAVTHYLKAVAASRTKDAPTVMKTMRETPIEDFMTRNGRLREDGRVIRDMHLFQVKTPAESKHPFDYYKHVATVPGDKAFRSMDQGDCPLVRSKP